MRSSYAIRKKTELDAAITQELQEEKDREIENSWKPRTYRENARALVESLLPDNKTIKQRVQHRQAHDV